MFIETRSGELPFLGLTFTSFTGDEHTCDVINTEYNDMYLAFSTSMSEPEHRGFSAEITLIEGNYLSCRITYKLLRMCAIAL